MEVITSLAQKNGDGSWNQVPIGVEANYVFKGTDSLLTILNNIETRLANIEACLKEAGQESNLDFTTILDANGNSTIV